MILQTERLIIQKPQPSDFDAVWMMKNDDKTTYYTGGKTKLNREEYRTWYNAFCENFGSNSNFLYSVILKSSNEYIGYCGFQYCDILNDIEILYGYSRSNWNKGFAFESANKLISFGFNELELHRILAAVNPENIASEKVLIKIGMKFDSYIEWPKQGLVKKYSLKKP